MRSDSHITCTQLSPPFSDILRLLGQRHNSAGNDNHVHHQIHGNNRHGNANNFAHTLQEKRTKPHDHDQSNSDLAVHERWRVLKQRILNQMLCSIRSGQSNRDNEVRGRESQQRQNEKLARPASEQSLQHRNRTLTMRRRLGDSTIDRDRTKKSYQNEEDRCQRSQAPGAGDSDGRLVGKCAEVINTRQAKHPEPKRLMMSRPSARGGAGGRAAGVIGARRCRRVH